MFNERMNKHAAYLEDPKFAEGFGEVCCEAGIDEETAELLFKVASRQCSVSASRLDPHFNEGFEEVIKHAKFVKKSNTSRPLHTPAPAFLRVNPTEGGTGGSYTQTSTPRPSGPVSQLEAVRNSLNINDPMQRLKANDIDRHLRDLYGQTSQLGSLAGRTRNFTSRAQSHIDDYVAGRGRRSLGNLFGLIPSKNPMQDMLRDNRIFANLGNAQRTAQRMSNISHLI